MKKNDLKKLIKPLVKECIHEVLLEEGLLSNVVAEVAKGMQGNLVVETRQNSSQALVNEEQYMKQQADATRKKLQSRRAELMNTINADAYNGVNLFEGTDALNSAGNPGSETKPQGALANYAPEDEGVDISGLLNLAGGSWKKI